MHKLISNINNAYSARHVFAYVLFRKAYLTLLQFLMKKNLIAYYSIKLLNSQKYIFIKLNYIKNKPMFFLKLVAKNSDPKYYKAHNIQKYALKAASSYTLVSTSSGWQILSRLCSYSIGGKLMVNIVLTEKNLDG